MRANKKISAFIQNNDLTYEGLLQREAPSFLKDLPYTEETKKKIKSLLVGSNVLSSDDIDRYLETANTFFMWGLHAIISKYDNKLSSLKSETQEETNNKEDDNGKGIAAS